MSAEAVEEAPCIPLTPFVVQLMEQSARDLEWTTNRVLDSYQTRAERAEATVALIQDRAGALLDGPYMPSTAALIRALYP